MNVLNKVKYYIQLNKSLIIGWASIFIMIMVSDAAIYYLVVNRIDSIETVKIVDNYINTSDNVNEEIPKEVHYKVDVKGAVNKPGVYELKEGSRIIDAINMAGGTKNADTSVINLSKYITDGMTIVLYTKEEVKDFTKVLQEEKLKEEQCIIYNEVIVNDACKDGKEENTEEAIDQKISINTANLELLITIPGIGEAKAKSIIEYRNNNGLFKTIEEIMQVSGIGESLFEKIKDYISV